MDRQYWIDRMGAAKAMARKAPTWESRLFHRELAGWCGIRAAGALKHGAASAGELLYLPVPAPVQHAPERFRCNDNEPFHG